MTPFRTNVFNVELVNSEEHHMVTLELSAILQTTIAMPLEKQLDPSLSAINAKIAQQEPLSTLLPAHVQLQDQHANATRNMTLSSKDASNAPTINLEEHHMDTLELLAIVQA